MADESSFAEDTFTSDDLSTSMKSWVTPNEHRDALLALQLPLRRRILDVLERLDMTAGEVAQALGLDVSATKYHLDVLVSAYLLGCEGGRYSLTNVGRAYQDHRKVEVR